MAVGISGLALSALLLFGLSEAGVNPVAAKWMSIPAVVFSQFLANKFWTFKI